MSLYEATTPLPKPWLNIFANNIECNNLTVNDILEIDGPVHIIEPTSSTITGALASGVPLLITQNTDTTVGSFQTGISCVSQLGSSIALVPQNNLIATAQNGIWSGGSISIVTFQSTSDIALAPNGVNALESIYDSPGVTHTLIQNLQLQTSGGTPTNLNYYENLTLSQIYSGIWVLPVTANMYITRIGNIVNITFQEVLAVATAANSISMSTVLPTRFRPTLSGGGVTTLPMILQDDGNYIGGCMQITTGGIMQITVYSNAYTGAGLSGFRSNNISYLCTSS